MSSSSKKRAKALHMSGVGSGATSCHYDCTVPIGCRTVDGRNKPGTYTTPVAGDSDLPCAVGNQAMIDNRAILDMSDPDNLTIAFCGPGDIKIEYPPGTDVYKIRRARSGHFMLPCCNYASAESREGTMTMLTEEAAVPTSDTADMARAGADAAMRLIAAEHGAVPKSASSSSSSAKPSPL